MYLYLDESGNLGFNSNGKHSFYFVITILASQNFSLFKSAIKRTLRNKVNHTKKKRLVNELKGSSTTMEIKKYFYNLLKDDKEWYLHTIILDKKHLSEKSNYLTDTEKLYNFLSKKILEDIDIPANSNVIHLYIDKRKTKNEIKIFDAYIKLNLEVNIPPTSILNIEHLNSEKNAGIQAVDMFCYGIAKKYERGECTWYNIFKDKIKKEIIYSP